MMVREQVRKGATPEVLPVQVGQTHAKKEPSCLGEDQLLQQLFFFQPHNLFIFSIPKSVLVKLPYVFFRLLMYNLLASNYCAGFHFTDSSKISRQVWRPLSVSRLNRKPAR